MSGDGDIAGHAFISYVREDRDAADRLQHLLEATAIKVWRDTANLWPGQNWRLMIHRAIADESLVFIACFSRNSVARELTGQNEELVLAIESMQRRPHDVPWLIPVRFDDCVIPDRDIGGGQTLRSIQRADLFGDRYEADFERLVAIVRSLLGSRAQVPGSSDTQRPPAPAAGTTSDELEGGPVATATGTPDAEPGTNASDDGGSGQRARWMRVVGLLMGSAVVIAAVTAGIVFLARNGSNPQPSPTLPITTTPAPASSSPAQTHATAKIRRHGILVLLGNNTAYDLDSLAGNWDPLQNATWVSQNIVYNPNAKPGVPGLDIAYAPATDVLMGTKGPWTYADCLNAPYDPSDSGNPNIPVGTALNVGHGICIMTQNTTKRDGKPVKTDGGHYVLIVVKARTQTTLTLEVTVWR